MLSIFNAWRLQVYYCDLDFVTFCRGFVNGTVINVFFVAFCVFVAYVAGFLHVSLYAFESNWLNHE